MTGYCVEERWKVSNFSDPAAVDVVNVAVCSSCSMVVLIDAGHQHGAGDVALLR